MKPKRRVKIAEVCILIDVGTERLVLRRLFGVFVCWSEEVVGVKSLLEWRSCLTRAMDEGIYACRETAAGVLRKRRIAWIPEKQFIPVRWCRRVTPSQLTDWLFHDGKANPSSPCPENIRNTLFICPTIRYYPWSSIKMSSTAIIHRPGCNPWSVSWRPFVGDTSEKYWIAESKLQCSMWC